MEHMDNTPNTVVAITKQVLALFSGMASDTIKHMNRSNMYT